MHISDILKAKGGEVVTVGPEDTITMAARRIAEKGKGLAVVCDARNSPLGIISVIDVNRAVAEHGERAPGMAVRDLMNKDIVACAPTESIEQALDKMTERGIRHLPVVADGALQGIVNIKDLLEARFQEAQIDVEEMRRYVFGAGYH